MEFQNELLNEHASITLTHMISIKYSLKSSLCIVARYFFFFRVSRLISSPLLWPVFFDFQSIEIHTHKYLKVLLKGSVQKSNSYTMEVSYFTLLCLIFLQCVPISGRSSPRIRFKWSYFPTFLCVNGSKIEGSEKSECVIMHYIVIYIKFPVHFSVFIVSEDIFSEVR